jgi:hypothetical protein
MQLFELLERRPGKRLDRLAKAGLALFKLLENVLTNESAFRSYLQRDLARPAADYELPAQRGPAWHSVAKRARVVRRDQGFAVAFDGGEIPLGASYPTVEWMLKQRMFSVDDALTRQPGVDRETLLGDLGRLERAGIIVATEMR